TASMERYKATAEQVDAYTESFRAANLRFTEGVGSVVEYLIAKNNLDRSKTNLIVGRYDYLLRTKILDYYQSKPLW
ncbi:MAG TPA: TolC family protein, partial [Chitinophagaceae bacterium]|nr:TolC family protein [Chitinophagaceae bacterium]